MWGPEFRCSWPEFSVCGPGVRDGVRRCRGRQVRLELGLQLGGAVVVVVVVVVVGDVRAMDLQFLLCMFSLFFVFLQTEKTFL